MAIPQVVIDTSVLVSGLRSRRGASYLLLSHLGSGKFEINISVPLLLEYEQVTKRLPGETALTEQDVEAVLDYLCRVANRRAVYYLWRPLLRDPKDDMVLELAVAAGCDCIITFNHADFQGADQFGVRLRTPKEFLQEIGVLP
jgi:putative PIN family toxin of toxin-antitoxin system